ncbi:MAG: T9SS type A sorting domain-containing protein, partial [Flavobacteriaceae bacterium]|nr:T9SS type A sorting domain-containing protein [Flavobacteriaceae bacterium]
YLNNLNNGLKGEYFNNTMTLSGSPTLTRTDATVGFDWINGTPDPSINVDNFSVRWSGFVQPLYSETYTFSTSSDDGIRLWVNGVQIINNWSNHSVVTNTGTISLIAGVKYSIVLEYYENTGQAVSKLLWSSPTNPTSVIIPTTQLFLVSNCPSPTSANVVINAQPATPSAPTVGTITQPDCVTDGSVVLSNLPATGTISQTGTSTNSYTITATTMTISGLAAGSYNFKVSNGTCTSSATGNVVINAAVTNTWNGTAWSNGIPNSTQKIVFSGNYPPAAPAFDPDVDITGCSCKVTGATAVIIKSGKTLTITNEVTVLGTLTFENTSSLVQTNNAAINSGNITYKRTSSSALTSDYTYWSSPVENQSLNISLSYASGMFYSYDDFATPEGWKKETATTIMQIGKGYIIRGPQVTGPPPPPGLYDAILVGVPNNGAKTIAIGATGTSNLLGNPYPSAINADTFLSANSAFIEGTLYFWTHNTAIQIASNIESGKAGSGVLAYTSDDYASYNGTGGVAVSGGIIPTGKIAAGQAFFTTSKATGGSVTFNNAMRLAGTTLVNKTGVNQQFFKTKTPNTKTENTIEKNRVWLNLSNNQGAFKQTLVGYITDATNDYDSRFDGESFDGNEFVDFYSVNQDKNLVIQGRALPFDKNDTVPLGFKSTIDGAFTINIDQVDGLLTNQTVFIEDKLTNTVFDLKSGNYIFNTAAGTFDDRFVLRYNNKTLSVDQTDKEDGILVLYSNNYKTLIIHIDEMFTTVNSVALYSITGQNIANWEVNDSEQNNIQIPIKNVSSGVYIVKVKTMKGESSKKIIIR